MKFKLLSSLVLGFLAGAHIGNAHILPPGLPPGLPPPSPSTVPGTPITFPASFAPAAGTSFKVFTVNAGPQPGAQPLMGGDPSDPYSVIAGDVIVLNPGAAGTTPDNWAADARFFNPLDPTGQQGLPATMYEILYPNEVAAGFAAFQLLPKVSYLPGYTLSAAQDGSTEIYASEFVFGPPINDPSAMAAVIEITVVPEPRVASLLALGFITMVFVARLRRKTPRAVRAVVTSG